MRKTFFVLVPIFFLLLSQQAFADEITLNQVNKGAWKITDSGGQPVGTLKSVEDGAFSVQFTNGEYLGLILKTGDLKKPGRHPLVTEQEAQLYLDILKAIKKLK
jgi:hypothetical protein